MARRSSRSWKVLESRSPAPSSSRLGDHVADAGLVGRVLRRAAAERIFHRDQRHGGVLHEPGLDAAGRHQTLDFGGGVRRASRRSRSARSAAAPPSSAPRAGDQIGSRTFLLALRRGVLDQVAGHRALLVEPFLRGVANLFGGDGADAVRPAPDIVDAEPRGQRAAIPACQRRLVVLGVDRLPRSAGS